MARRLRTLDWRDTPLGPPDTWPQPLHSAVSLALHSPLPVILWLGPGFTTVYNDACAPVFGAQHLRDTQGRPGREACAVWDMVGPVLEGVLETGQAAAVNGLSGIAGRQGSRATDRFTLSCAPIGLEAGRVLGVFAVVTATLGYEVFVPGESGALAVPAPGTPIPDFGLPGATAPDRAASGLPAPDIRGQGTAAEDGLGASPDGQGPDGGGHAPTTGGSAAPLLYIECLRAAGYRVEAVGDGGAVLTARGAEPKVLLIGVPASDAGGYALLTRLRADPALKDVSLAALALDSAVAEGPRARVPGTPPPAGGFLPSELAPAGPAGGEPPAPAAGGHQAPAAGETRAPHMGTCSYPVGVEGHDAPPAPAADAAVDSTADTPGPARPARHPAVSPAHTHATPANLEQVLAGVSDAFTVLDADLRFIYANARAFEFAGLGPEALLGRRPWEVFPELAPDGPEMTRLRHALADGRAGTFRHYFPPAARWLEHRACPGPYGLSLFSTDVSAQIRAEQARARLDTVLAGIGEGFSMLDTDLRVTYVNERALALAGRPRAEILGKTPWEIFPGIEDLPEMDVLRRAQACQTPARVEGYFPPLGRWFEHRIHPGPAGVAVFTADVTDRRRAEAGLAASEELNRRLFESSSECIKVLDLEGRLLSMNAAGVAAMGAQDETPFLGLSLIEFMVGEHGQDETRAAVEAAARGGRGVCRAANYTLDGRLLRWHTVVTPILDPAGRPARLLAVSRGVTEEYRAEQARRTEAAWLKLLTDSLPVLISYVDREQRYRFANRQYEEWFGLTRAAIDGRHVREILGPRNYQALLPAVSGALAGQPQRFEKWVNYRKAGRRYVQVNYIPDRDPDGAVVGYFALVTDLTERKYAEEAVAESEARFRLMASTVPAMVWQTGLDGQAIYFNPRWLEYTGRPLARQLGGGWAEGIHPDDREHCLRAHADAFERRGRFETEYRLRRADGSYGWVLDAGAPRFTPSGKFLGYIGAAVDISARRHAEDALAESEARFRLMADNAPALVWMADADRHCYYFNARWLEYTGRTLAQEQNGGWAAGVHPEDLPGFLQTFDRAFAAREHYEAQYRLRRADGTYGWLLEVGVPRFTPEGEFTGYIGSALDVTGWVEAEHRLRESEQRLEAAYEGAALGICEADLEGRFLRVNRAFREIVGYSNDELLARTFADITHADDVGADLDLYADLQAGRIKSYTLEKRYLHRTGRDVWVRLSVSLVRGPRGEPLYGVAVTEDVTTRRQAEAEIARLNAQLRARAAELESLNDVVPAGLAVSHDPDCAVITVNRAFADTLGLPPGVNASRTTHPELPFHFLRHGVEVPAAELPMQVAARTGEAVPASEYDLRLGDGRSLHLLVKAVPLLDEAGRPSGAVGVHVDITEQRRREQEVLEWNQRYYAAAQASAQILFDWSPADGEFLCAGPTYLTLGVSPAEISSVHRLWRRVHPEDRPRLRAVLSRALASQPQACSMEFRLRHRDGHYLEAEGRGQFLLGPGGELRLVGFIEDITPRKHAQAVLRQARLQLELALEAGQLGVWDLDLRTQRAYGSPRHLQIFGYEEPPTDWGHDRFLAHVEAEDRGDVGRRLREVLAGDRDLEFECRIRRRDGELRWIWIRGRPYLSDDARRVLGVIMDVTARKQAELALAERANDLRIANLQVAQRERAYARLALSLEVRVEERTRQLRALTAELLATEERERKQLAADLHDSLGQMLTLAKIKLSRLKQDCPEAEAAANEVGTLVQQANLEARALTVRLSPPVLHELGLVAGLQWLAEHMQVQYNLGVKVEVAGKAPARDPHLDTVVFRAVRELLINVVKHARVQRAEVRVSAEPGQVCVRVRDRGAGCDPEQQARADHGYGLFAVRERLNYLGGHLSFTSHLKQGTTATICVPLGDGREPNEDPRRHR